MFDFHVVVQINLSEREFLVVILTRKCACGRSFACDLPLRSA